jgi:hypothetical protein
MLLKLFGGLAIAAGLVGAGLYGTSTATNNPAASQATCCAQGAECCTEDCCDSCPDCSCECDCCKDCKTACECPNMK